MVFKSPFYSLRGVVASEHFLASAVGAEVLKRGGNAIDATVAVSFALTVVLPHLGGIGGDFFALARSPEGCIYFVNGSGPAPSRLTRDLVIEQGYRSMPAHGPLSISVPGLVEGVHLLWKKLGTVEWRELVKPAIKLARNGFPASRSLSRALTLLHEELVKDYGSKVIYYSKGKAPQIGDVISFKGLARILEYISEDPRFFYEGDAAGKIIEYVNSLGGVLEFSDFKNYRAEIGDPISIEYRARRVYEMPPNTQGVTTLHMLKLLEEEDLCRIAPLSSDRLKLFLAAARVAYRARDEYITDPRYMKIGVGELLSPEFIGKLREKFEGILEANNTFKGDGDTTFFAVADKDGWIVAGIQSLFHGFGSYITEPTYGITLNSRASSFSLDSSHVNCLEPGKKTMHTLSAIISVDENDEVLALGLSGGHFRPLLHAQLFTNIFDYGMDPQEAIEHPRFIWHLWTRKVEYEEGYSLEGLKDYEFEKVVYPSRLGVAAAVRRKGKVLAGYTDIRGDGLPIGLE
ncbi:MAG: gamma-glutamyltransferase family protein [Thermoprotei archaeon]|nr:MAG: gamma-glutamyltransferase family protein [Thermoprotei archaeon]